MTDSIVKNKLSKPIDSLSISKEDLIKFLNVLQERSDAICEIECNHIESFVPAENLEKSKEDLRSCSNLRITINGSDGEELFGNIDEVFSSVSFPDQLLSVYVNSELLYKSQFNYIPRNQFEVYLDFTKPKVLDFSFEPSDKTPNGSMFSVEGFDNTLVNGVFSEIDSYFQKHSSNFSKIHRNSIYDLLVWSFGLPLGFWTCYKVSEFIIATFSNVFLQSAMFLYFFLVTLIVLRVLFHYFRWLYSKIIYENANDITFAHRGFFYAISIGIVGAFLYDIFRLIFIK